MATTAMSKAEQNALTVSYDVGGSHVDLDLEFVKRYLVRGKAEMVSDQEVVFFMNLCKMQRLNPLSGSEVYLIKYSQNDPAQVVVGKNAYLRRAFEHPDYLCKEEGITVLRNGNEIAQKEGTCLYPGEKLVGGWCRVHYNRNGVERTAFKEVSYEEYNKGQANWKSKPATMISKVAVSQCVREAFPKDFDGLYSEEEMVASGAVPANSIPDDTIPTYDVDTATGEVVQAGNTEENRIINQEERQELLGLIKKKFGDSRDVCNEVFTRAMNEVGLKSMAKMTVGQWKMAKQHIEDWASELEDETDDEDDPEEE